MAVLPPVPRPPCSCLLAGLFRDAGPDELDEGPVVTGDPLEPVGRVWTTVTVIGVAESPDLVGGTVMMDVSTMVEGAGVEAVVVMTLGVEAEDGG